MFTFAMAIALVVFVATANVCLGFGAAWLLGRGPHRWTPADFEMAQAAWGLASSRDLHRSFADEPAPDCQDHGQAREVEREAAAP